MSNNNRNLHIIKNYLGNPNLKINEELMEESIGRDEPKELSGSEYGNEGREIYNNSNIANRSSKNIDVINPILNESSHSKDANTSYKNLLEQKIRNQAKRLYELQDYKNLCEKRILQIYPDHPIPLEEKHLGGLIEKKEEIEYNSFHSNEKIPKSIADMGQNKIILNKIINLENENKVLKEENLKLKYFPIYDPQSINQFTSEKIQQSYLLLQNSYQSLVKEKESILEILREETIANEEQRNYIDMLRKTIENNINNDRLYSMLNNQRNIHYSKNLSIIDVVLDISKLQHELENKIKENNNLQNTISGLKTDFELTKQMNSELNNKKEKIIESLEKGINELEQAKQRVKDLEKEKYSLLDELKEIREFHEKILSDYKAISEKYNSSEKKVAELESLKIELGRKADENKSLHEEIQATKEDNIKLEKKLSQIKSEFEKISLEKCQIDQISDEFLTNHKNLKVQYEDLNKNFNEKLTLLNLSEENLKRTQIILTEKTEKINHLFLESEKNKLNLNEKALKIENLLKEKEEISKENQKLKNDNMDLNSEIKIMSFKLSDMTNQMTILQRDIDFISKDNIEKNNIIAHLKSENEKALLNLSSIKQQSKSELGNLKEENENLNNLLEKNNKEIETLKFKFDQINQRQLNRTTLNNNTKENFQKETLLLKKKIDELNYQIENLVLDIEEKKSIIRNYEKDNELIKIERDKYIKFYEKEKFENANNLNLIKLLEEEKTKKENNKNTEPKNLNHFNPLISENNSAKFNDKSIKIIDKNFSNIKIGINSCISIIEIFSQKYHDFTKNPKNNSKENPLLNNDNENVANLDNKSGKEHEYMQLNKNFKESKNLEEWCQILLEELNACYKSINEYENKQDIFKWSDSKERTILNDIEILENQRLISELQKTNNNLSSLNNELKSKNERLVNESNSFRNDNKKLYDQNKKLLEDYNKNISLQKENKFFENILLKILNNHPSHEIKSAANNMIDLFDITNNIEKDKIKLEKNLEILENEYGVIVNDKTGNEELESSLLKQIGNMKILVMEYERKILEKNNEIAYLEEKCFSNDYYNSTQSFQNTNSFVKLSNSKNEYRLLDSDNNNNSYNNNNLVSKNIRINNEKKNLINNINSSTNYDNSNKIQPEEHQSNMNYNKVHIHNSDPIYIESNDHQNNMKNTINFNSIELKANFSNHNDNFDQKYEPNNPNNLNFTNSFFNSASLQYLNCNEMKKDFSNLSFKQTDPETGKDIDKNNLNKNCTKNNPGYDEGKSYLDKINQKFSTNLNFNYPINYETNNLRYNNLVKFNECHSKK